MEPNIHCGGMEIVYGSKFYEVLGARFSTHLHKAVAYVLDFTTGADNEKMLCILRETPDGSVEAVEHLYRECTGLGYPLKSVRKTVCADQKQLPKSLDKLGELPNGQVMVQLATVWGQVLGYGKSENRAEPRCAWREQGKVAIYNGSTVYLNGVGRSTENKDSIVIYIDDSFNGALPRYVRLEYTGDKLHSEVYRMNEDYSWRRSYVRHFTIEEAKKSRRYKEILGWLRQAAVRFYGLPELWNR